MRRVRLGILSVSKSSKYNTMRQIRYFRIEEGNTPVLMKEHIAWMFAPAGMLFGTSRNSEHTSSGAPVNGRGGKLNFFFKYL